MDYLQLTYFVPVLCLILLQPSCSSGSSAKTHGVCLNQTNAINVNCENGTMVRILKTIYGHSSSGICSYSPGDCIFEDKQDYPCVGKASCSLNLPSGGYGRTIPSCNLQSNYFQIEYICVPQTRTTDICTVGKMTEQTGYLASPNYPQNYPENLDCVAEIELRPDQNVKLYLIDMDLESNRSLQCLDWMKVDDTSRSITLCGRRSNEAIGISSNKLSIRLVTNNEVKHKGIWLYYEADPLITTTVPTTSSPIVTTTKTNTQAPMGTTGKPADIPITKKHSDNGDNDKLPFAAIIGGVIGSLSFILIILLILLAVKWWREKRSPHNKNHFIEVQNPAYRNSAEFRSSTHGDNYYNYIDC